MFSRFLALKRIEKSLLVLFVLGLMFSCGGNDITFPQGPTSGADDVTYQFPKLALEPMATFRLRAKLTADEKQYRLTWSAPEDAACTSFRIILAPEPHAPDPGNVQVTQLALAGETHENSFTGDEVFYEFVNSSPIQISALVLCVPEADATTQYQPYLRSNFQNLNALIQNHNAP